MLIVDLGYTGTPQLLVCNSTVVQVWAAGSMQQFLFLFLFPKRCNLMVLILTWWFGYYICISLPPYVRAFLSSFKESPCLAGTWELFHVVNGRWDKALHFRKAGRPDPVLSPCVAQLSKSSSVNQLCLPQRFRAELSLKYTPLIKPSPGVFICNKQVLRSKGAVLFVLLGMCSWFLVLYRNCF